MRKTAASCAVLILLIILAFSETRRCDFVDFDDNWYVTENPLVKNGMSWDAVKSVFTGFHCGYWMPLTLMSHMADCEFFGLDPRWHHLVNVAIHACSTLLLFAAQTLMGLPMIPSLLVAAAFGVHPLRVESVAWVAERKDVLCAFFWMLALFSYARYARKPSVARYLAVLASFILGIMSKPMIVTLPFALLLLDFWPLRRHLPLAGTSPGNPSSSAGGKSVWRASARRWGILVAEKLPFFLLLAPAIILTCIGEEHAGALDLVERGPLLTRLELALVFYAKYLLKIIWPTDLAVPYPYPDGPPPLWQSAASLFVIVLVTTAVIRRYRSSSPLAVGWLWFLGTMVPMIGLMQAGLNSMADRFTYIPSVGFFIMAFHGLLPRLPGPRLKTAVTAVLFAVVSAWAALSRVQVLHWKDTLALFAHTTEVTERNFLAQAAYGLALFRMEKNAEASVHLKKALNIRPVGLETSTASGKRGLFHLYSSLAYALIKHGKHLDSTPYFLEALRMEPNSFSLTHDAGIAFSRSGEHGRAVKFLSKAMVMQQEWPDRYEMPARQVRALTERNFLARITYGVALCRMERYADAVAQLREAIRIKPVWINEGTVSGRKELFSLQATLAGALLRQGKALESTSHFEEAMRLEPDDFSVTCDAGTAFSRAGKHGQAVRLFNKALGLRRESPPPDITEKLNSEIMTIIGEK